MPEKEHLRTWVVEALPRLGGQAWLIDGAGAIWNNQEGELLEDMYRIEIRAFKKRLGREVLIEKAEAYRYSPLYQPESGGQP